MVEKRIVCVTSTSCLSYAPERYKNLGIEQFHIVVNYNDKDYLEGLDLDPKEFFKTLETLEDPKNHLPHSAIPSFESIREKFQSIVDKGYTEAIIITLSSYLGGTFNAIQLVAKEFEEQLKTTMIDSKITGFGLRFPRPFPVTVADMVKNASTPNLSYAKSTIATNQFL